MPAASSFVGSSAMPGQNAFLTSPRPHASVHREKSRVCGESASLEMRLLDLLKKWEHLEGDRTECFSQLTNLHEILSKGVHIPQVTMGTPDWFYDFAPWSPRTGTLLILRGGHLAAAIQNRGDGVLKLTAFEPLGPTSYQCLARLGVRDVEGLPNRVPAWKRIQSEMETCCFNKSDYRPLWMEAGDEVNVLSKLGLDESFLSKRAVPANFTSRELSLLYRQDF